MKRIICFSLFLLSFAASAEYRVYQYYVRSRLLSAEHSKPYLVTSSLDPVSYVAYHGGDSSIKVDMLRTWMCPGNTSSFQEYCANPYDTILKEEGVLDES